MGFVITNPAGTPTAVANITQLAGTAIDTNSGNKSAGTERIVIATDQPQLTNALKVDPSAVTSPISNANLDATLSTRATEATLASIKAKTDNLDVLLSTRTKPADAQHVIVDSSAAVPVTGPLTNAELRAAPVPVSGTVTANLGTIAGVATAAKQDTGNNSLNSIDVATGIIQGNIATLTSLSSDPFGGAYIRQDANDTIAKESGGKLENIDNNTLPLLNSGSGGYIRQDANATIAKETGGNLEVISKNILLMLSVLKSQQDLLFMLVTTANQNSLRSD